jgi:hypothetical protein
MRTHQVIFWLVLLLGLAFLSLSGESDKPANGKAAAAVQVTNISIFFGTSKVVSLEELRRSATTTLGTKGHKVPDSAECGISITVQGPQAGCSVMFFDLEKKWQYLVRYNALGQVAEVWQGEMRHGTVGPNDPKPTVPAGAVKVDPPATQDQDQRSR